MPRSLCAGIILLALTTSPTAAQVKVTKVSPASPRLDAGGGQLTLSIEGTSLQTVSDVRILRSRMPSKNISAAIQPSSSRTVTPTRTLAPAPTLTVALQAQESAAAGSYQLELLVGRQWITVPATITVVASGPSVSTASPAQVTLQAAGNPGIITLHGSGLDDLTGAYLERGSTRMDGRVNAQLKPTADPTRRDVEVVAYASAGPPWGSSMKLVLEASPQGAPMTIATSVAITVPAPPVDLVISSCAFDSSGPLSRTARATLTNNGSAGVSFQSGQVLARAKGVGPDQNLQAPGGGRYIAAGGSLQLSTSLNLSGLQPGTLAITWTADPYDLIVEANGTNNGKWCPFVLAPLPPPPPVAPAAPLPDLVISSLNVTPNAGPPSTQFVVSAVYQNAGAGPTARIGPTVIGYVPNLGSLQPDCTINGVLLHKSGLEFWFVYRNGATVTDPYDWVGLNGGQSGTFFFKLPLGMAPGSKVLDCTLLYQQPETSSANNGATRVFTVGNP